MSDEYKNDNTEFGNAPQEPAPEQSTSAFQQTVFSSMQEEKSAEPVQAEQSYTAPEPVQAEQSYTAPEPVQAEQNYTPPEPEPQVSQQPYSAPYYTQQNIPPYGQNASGSAYSQQNPYYSQTSYSSPYAQPTQPVQPPKKERKGLKVFLILLVTAVILGLTIACISLAISNKKNSVVDSDGNTITAAANAPELETKASPASDSSAKSGQVLTPTQIAEKVRGSSVGILVYANNKTGLASEGSGVLWKEDDSHTYTYIITCAHVINGSGYTYTVQTDDGETYDAEMVGADAKTDLGVLRIKATGLQLAEFGDSGALKVGDPVYAIGNPGGTEFFGSFTNGIVSAIDRSVKSTYTMVCIQHTAAINPGNSGGALVNQYGQVIGINSQKIIDTEYEGMGFAIPIKSAQSIINSLASYGYVANRPRLGITYTEAVNYQQYSMIIKIKGMPSGSLIITEIAEDSSLANTDARQYDMIIAVDGEDMSTPSVLLDKIENGKVGDKLKLTLCRIDNNYQTTTFDVTVTLVEEKKDSAKETTTAQSYNPYDFFNEEFFNGLF
ncbi:MAG: trypsin-like peptidase domain-containing protein [Acutalibacteraceae bacterium]